MVTHDWTQKDGSVHIDAYSSISPLNLNVCIPPQEFKTSGSSNTDTSKVNGNLETKYKWSEYGLTFTEKWNTDNTLGTEITVEDQVK